MPRPRREVEWADGIRGIASLFIVTSHCVRAFIPNYLYPADYYGGTPHLFQLPFFRIIATGPFWTAIFFVLSGYVCAIKPIRLSNVGQSDEARKAIASSAFRRVLRIGVPATFGTILPWVMCQCGLFDYVTRNVRYLSGWLPDTTPQRIPGFFPPLKNFIKQCFNTWAIETNEYERNQWTLTHEMRGSLLLFLVLTATASYTKYVRRMILFLAALYFFNSGEFIAPFCFFGGSLLADLSLTLIANKSMKDAYENSSSRPQRLGIVARHWPEILAFFALFLGTMPPESQDYVKYSRSIYFFFSDHITPVGGDSSRVIGAFAAILLIISILFSSPLRYFLSNPFFVFLGSVSFPLYLLHGTFIRIPLQWAVIWLLPRLAPDALEYYDGDGYEWVELKCGLFTCKFVASVIFIVWLSCLLAFSKFWKDHVDVFGIWFSRWAEEYSSGKRTIHIITELEWLTSFGGHFPPRGWFALRGRRRWQDVSGSRWSWEGWSNLHARPTKTTTS